MEGLKEYNIAILSVNGLGCLLGAHSLTTEAGTEGVIWKKVLLKISQNLQENICVAVFFNKIYLRRGSDISVFLLMWRTY